jgi:hypothetical protein
MQNINPHTGIRYGVISFNSLQPWCSDDLFYGAQAKDISWQQAIEELVAEAKREYDDLLEECDTAMAEVDHWMSDREKEKFTERFFSEREARMDRDEFVEERVERRREHLDISEPGIEGTLDGVSYRISWLGGAPLLWVLEGPLGFANRLCSPCVPNAADLDGGFEPTSIPLADIHRDHDGYLCYVVPQSWLADKPEAA